METMNFDKRISLVGCALSTSHFCDQKTLEYFPFSPEEWKRKQNVNDSTSFTNRKMNIRIDGIFFSIPTENGKEMGCTEATK